MSRDIQSIMNVTAYAILDNTGSFSVTGGFPPTPDEIVIRQITYDSSSLFPSLFMIQSSIGNQIIGSIANVKSFHVEPMTRIQPKNPLPNILQFTLLTLAGAPAMGGVSADLICIHMDFIIYKKL